MKRNIIKTFRIFIQYWHNLTILIAYTIFTLIFLAPFSILKMDKWLIGHGGDGWQNLWNLWWMKESLLVLHTNPLETKYIFYPIGANLLFHTLSPIAGILTIPMQLTAGLVFGYNFLVIFSFIFSGYGAYLLAMYLTKDNISSFFSGLVFAFSPYHLAHTLGHLTLFQ